MELGVHADLQGGTRAAVRFQVISNVSKAPKTAGVVTYPRPQ